MRKMTRTIRTGIVAGVILLATMVLAPTSAVAEPSTPPSGGPSNDPGTTGIQESLDYLMTKYHVSQAEALRRLELQAHAADMAKAVHAKVGDELLSVWLDQDNGGKLTFLTSQPDTAQAALGKQYDAKQVKLVKSKFTAVQLHQAEAVTKAQLAGSPDVQVGIDTRHEVIDVHYNGTDAKHAATVRGKASPTAGDSVPVVVDTSGPPPPGQQRSCAILACDPPMRGGVRLHIRRDDGSWGSCTTGFNVRGSNGWIYILTAGHCVTKPGPKRQYAYHNGLPAVWEKSTGNDSDPNATADNRYFNNDPPHLDWALMPYQTDGAQWSAYWLNNRRQHNLVQSACVSPSNQGCSNGAYAINGMYTWDQLQVGWIVCATGTGTGTIYSEDVGYTPGTRCGSIGDKDMTGYCYSCSWPWGWGLRVDICSREGDSGGPLFSQIDSKAYGILSGGPSRTGACNMADHDEFSVYSPLSEDLNDASSKTGITMSLVTTSTG